MLSLWDSLRSSTQEGRIVPEWTMPYVSKRNSASMEIQGLEVLSIRDALRRRTHLSIRWRHRKILCPKRDFLQMHLQERGFFWFTSDAFLKRPILSFWDSYMRFLPGVLQARVVPERTTYCVTWRVPQRVPSSVSASRLRSDASSWEKHLRP